MKTKLSFVLLALILSGNLFAQDSLSYLKNNMYIELLGNGGLGSINYEHRIEKWTFLRIGFSLLPTSSCSGIEFSKSSFILLLGGNRIIPFYKNSTFEIGICTTIPIVDRFKRIEPFWALTAGYKLQPSNGGFIFKLTSSFMYEDEQIYVWPGLSLGYNF